MQNNFQKNNESLKAIAVGFLLIIAVVAIIFYKSQSTGEKKSLTNTDNSDLTEKKLDKSAGISATNLNSEMIKRDDLVIIDLREANKFYEEHIIDAKNISIDELSPTLSQMGLNKYFVIIDEAENPDIIQSVMDQFSAMDYSNVSYLAGGFTAWKDAYGRTISDGNPLSFTDQSKVNYINCDDLKKTIDSGEDLLIIDVRKSRQYSEGHIKNSLNIFLDDIEQRRKEIPYGKKIIVYDNDGLWAFKAASRLFDLGILNVLAVSDGLDTWKKKGYEIAR